MILRYQGRVQKCFFAALCLFLLGDGVGYFMAAFLRLPTAIGGRLVLIVQGLAILGSVRCVFKRVPPWCMWLLAVWFMDILLSWLVQGDYNSMYQHIIKYFIVGSASFLYFFCLSDYERFLKWINIIALVVPVSMLVLVRSEGFGVDEKTGEEMSYGMGYAYTVLNSAIICLNGAMQRRGVLYYFSSVAGIFALIGMGTRGPLVCALMFVTLRIFIFLSNMNIRKLFLGAIALSGGSAILFNYLESLLGKIAALLLAGNLSTRVLETFLQGIFISHDSGRSEIKRVARQIIDENFFTGVGIGRDRIMIARYMGSPSQASGLYAHSIFYEFCLQFGLIIGLFLIACLLIVLAKSFFIANKAAKDDGKTAHRDVILIMIAIGLFPLFFSHSYVQRVPFFMMLGVCLGTIRRTWIHSDWQAQLVEREGTCKTEHKVFNLTVL